MTDESGQSYPFTPNTLLDNALGSLGYYGAFTVNLHTDNATTPEDDALLSSATSRGVPMVTVRADADLAGRAQRLVVLGDLGDRQHADLHRERRGPEPTG